MKKYLLGFLTAVALLFLNNVAYYYGLDHDNNSVLNVSFLIEHALKLNYLIMPLTGRCDPTLKRDYNDGGIIKTQNSAQYFECDKLQIALNLKRSL